MTRMKTTAAAATEAAVLGAVALLLSGCETGATIELVSAAPVDGPRDNLSAVTATRPSRAPDGADGVTEVEVSSSSDLAAIVREKEMSHLYYVLHPCSGTSDLLSGDVFEAGGAGGGHRYVFYLPGDLRGEIEGFAAMRGRTASYEPSDLCARLGAGNMAGGSLETNSVALGEALARPR